MSLTIPPKKGVKLCQPKDLKARQERHASRYHNLEALSYPRALTTVSLTSEHRNNVQSLAGHFEFLYLQNSPVHATACFPWISSKDHQLIVLAHYMDSYNSRKWVCWGEKFKLVLILLSIILYMIGAILGYTCITIS